MSQAIKRHCMIVHAYYPIGEPRVQREAEALVDNHFQVDVICLCQPGEPRHAVVNDVNVYRLPVHRHKGKGLGVQFLEYWAFFFIAAWRLITLYSQRRYNVIQVHNLPDFLVFAALVPRLLGARIILDLHDLMPEFYASRFQASMKPWQESLIRWQEHVSCRFADHVITVTEPWRQTLIQRGVPPAKCSVVMNVADTRLFRRDKVSAPRAEDGRFHLFYHGTLARRYGIDLALLALNQLRCEMPDLYLTIHGRGEYLGELQTLARDLGLGESVHFSTGYVPMEELPALIATADLGLIPYRRDVFTDGILPTKLMEYAALGVPAIAARTLAIEAYFDESMVQFINPGDLDDLTRCIRELYHDRSRLAALSKNTLQFNQRYNWMVQSADYVKLVDTLRCSIRATSNKIMAGGAVK